MQLGEHDLHGGHALAVGRVHHVHGNAAAVVDHGDGVVDVDDNVDFLAVAGERLVDGVVNDFVDKVMQPHLAGRADVHGGTEANGLKAFEDLDVFAGVAVVVAVHGGAAQNFSRHTIPFARSSVMSRVAGALSGRSSGINRLKREAMKLKREAIGHVQLVRFYHAATGAAGAGRRAESGYRRCYF